MMAASDHLGAQWFHGSPSGDLRGGHYGLHVGTRQAANDALNARIGTPADGGEWDGTRRYGDTLLRGPHATSIGGERHRLGPDHYPTGKAQYSDGSEVGVDAIPEVMPLEITGRMTNTPQRPHEDYKANGYMQGQIKRGRAKSGYYYENVSEDEGSISAVVPGKGHVRRPDEGEWKQMRLF